MQTWKVISISAVAILSLVAGAASAHAEDLWPDFPALGQTPYPANHVNPQHNDSIPLDAPTGLELLWHSAPNYSYFNPCSSGPEGHVYCASYKDPTNPEGECNLIALDYQTGELLWDDGDSNGGVCLLDSFAFPTTPLVDRDGNVYAADSQRIVSYTADGQVRWMQNYPALLTAGSPTGKPNTPFGMNVLPTGELITGTLGDAFILVMDRGTGDLLAEPFDLPASKLAGGGEGLQRPEWALEKFGGPVGAQAVWDSSFADTDNENDNDISVDGHTGTIFVTSAAEAPNDLCEEPDDPATPCGDGKLWALEYDSSQPFASRISVVFTVRFPGPGGSATTPTVSTDGRYVVVGNNDMQALAVDLPACLAQFAGTPGTPANDYNECTDTATFDLPTNLFASPALTPDNKLLTLGAVDGVIAAQIAGGGGSPITITPLWTYGDDIGPDGQPADEMPAICEKTLLLPGETLLPFPLPVPCEASPQTFTNASSVITAFNNVAYVAYLTVQPLAVDPIAAQIDPRFAVTGLVTPAIVAIDIETGGEISITPFDEGAGDLSNVTMAADGVTLLTNDFNFVVQTFWDRGLLGFNPNPIAPPLDTFKLIAPKPFDQAKSAGVKAFVPIQPELPISGKNISVKTGNQTSFTFQSDDLRNDVPAQGSALDPRLRGAVLQLFNPTTGENETFDLAAENWTYRAHKDEYRYSDGVCGQIDLQADRLKVDCVPQSFTLDEASQGSLGVSFSLTPARHLCALFGGNVSKDSGSARKGTFASAMAERSEDCAIPE
jgi:hypothetical protein